MIDCERFRWRPPAIWLAVIISSLLFLTPGVRAEPSPPATAPDDGFATRHPRLLFSSADLPALRARIHNGGADDDAYAFIRSLCFNVYPGEPFDSLIQGDAALEPMINLVLVSHLEAQVDSNLVSLGRDLTLHIARNWSVDTDPYGTSLRLRAMSLGFDHFFVHASPTERNEIRTRAQSYMSYISTNVNFDIWMQRPYVSNKTAMVSGALGLAAICFKDELPVNVTNLALAKADAFYLSWRDSHLSNDGCYREGSLYIGWSMRNLIYYFAARKRYDGLDFSQEPVIRAIERWMPYELDPRGDGRVNNIQDQTDYYRPFARHTTYWAWAQSAWNSGIAAYMWERSAGSMGKDMLDENDKASTVLWHTGVAPQNPGLTLERSNLWEDRGLYYFRTGWPDGPTSTDVVFSFYSGEFRGGHAQEDQNQFTLAAYGEKLVLDQGAGSMAKQSEAHNLVRIDGLGEHNAGSSIGTDGRIADYVLSDFSDFVCGDATLAYSTHSPYNNPGVPYPWSNWSWGYSGANPVQYALRKIVAVHGAGAPPYFLIRDDVRKDDAPHHYDWCLHVAANAVVDVNSDPIMITNGAASLRVYPVYPPRTSLVASVTSFDNYNADPNSRLLMLGTDALDPHFSMLLLPLTASGTPPEITRTSMPGGAILKVGWGAGVIDDIVMQVPVAPGELSVTDPFPWAIETDAPVAVVRKSGPHVVSYTLVDGTTLSVGAVLMAAVEDGPASLVFDGTDVHLSRPDAQFRVRDDAVDAVLYRGVEVPSHAEGEFLVSGGPATSVSGPASGGLQLRVYPNPFNPSVQMTFVNPARSRVEATIHDAQGRTVRTLVSRSVEAGELRMTWDGRDDRSSPVASGVYFLRVRAGAENATRKLVLLR